VLTWIRTENDLTRTVDGNSNKENNSSTIYDSVPKLLDPDVYNIQFLNKCVDVSNTCDVQDGTGSQGPRVA